MSLDEERIKVQQDLQRLGRGLVELGELANRLSDNPYINTPMFCIKQDEPKRFEFTSHAEGSTLAEGELVQWVDNGTKSNPNDTVDVIIYDDKNTSGGVIPRFDQGPSTLDGEYTLTAVPTGEIRVCLLEILRNDQNDVIGVGEECCYTFNGLVQTSSCEICPEQSNESMMMACCFGNFHHGWRLNHTSVDQSRDQYITIIAEESGVLDAVSRHNRLDTGTSYSILEGGNWHITVMPETTPGSNVPDFNNVIGSSDVNLDFVAADTPSTGNDRLTIPLANPATLEIGCKYFIRWDSRWDTKGQGWSIFNGSDVNGYIETETGISDRGPWPGDPDHLKIYGRNDRTDAFISSKPFIVPWLSYRINGNWRGYVYYNIQGQVFDNGLVDGTYRHATRTIGEDGIGSGNNVAIQHFEYDNPVDRTVTELWLYYCHTFRYTVDGSPLTIELQDAAGNTLATGSIASNASMNQASIDGENLGDDIQARGSRTWGKAVFDTPVLLTTGTNY